MEPDGDRYFLSSSLRVSLLAIDNPTLSAWLMFFKKCVDRVKRIEILGDQVLFRQPRPDLLFHGGEHAQED
jgi:hypothetical protein